MARQVRQLKVKDGFVRNAMEGSLSESSRWSGGTRTIASLLERAGPDWLVPDFGTLYRQKTLTVRVPYRPGTGARPLLIDSTGLKFEGGGERCAKKHGT